MRAARPALLSALLAAPLSGCLVGTVVGTAVDVGVEVVKVPFKVGKGVYDVFSDDSSSKKLQAAPNGASR